MSCPICLAESISNGVRLECDHEFCADCIVSALRNDSRCPLCRHQPMGGDSSTEEEMYDSSSAVDVWTEEYEERFRLQDLRRRLLLRAQRQRGGARLAAARARLRLAERNLRRIRRELFRDAEFRKARARHATVRKQVIAAETAILDNDLSTSSWWAISDSANPRWVENGGLQY